MSATSDLVVDDATRQRIARELLGAYASGPVPPPSSGVPGLTVDDAYAVQQLQTTWRLESGRRVVGHKVGLTSAVMQRQLGVDEPDFGVLFDDMVVEDGATVPARRFLQPRAEPEVALVLGSPLAGPGVTADDVRRATAQVRPAIEVIDSRVADWRIGLVDTIADNASSGGLVLGPPVPLGELDLAAVGCVLRLDGAVVGTGTGADVMGSPLEAAAWLANVLGARGTRIEAGHVVLTGSITAAVPVSPGQVVAASVGDVGSVSVRFG